MTYTQITTNKDGTELQPTRHGTNRDAVRIGVIANNIGIVAVADGCGLSLWSEIAAHVAVNEFVAYMHDSISNGCSLTQLKTIIKKAIFHVNDKLLAIKHPKTKKPISVLEQGGNTTLLCAVIFPYMGSLVEFGESGNIPDEFKEDAEADAFEERWGLICTNLGDCELYCFKYAGEDLPVGQEKFESAKKKGADGPANKLLAEREASQHASSAPNTPTGLRAKHHHRNAATLDETTSSSLLKENRRRSHNPGGPKRINSDDMILSSPRELSSSSSTPRYKDSGAITDEEGSSSHSSRRHLKKRGSSRSGSGSDTEGGTPRSFGGQDIPSLSLPTISEEGATTSTDVPKVKTSPRRERSSQNSPRSEPSSSPVGPLDSSRPKIRKSKSARATMSTQPLRLEVPGTSRDPPGKLPRKLDGEIEAVPHSPRRAGTQSENATTCGRWYRLLADNGKTPFLPFPGIKEKHIPEPLVLQLKPGDMIFACSDGVPAAYADEQVELPPIPLELYNSKDAVRKAVRRVMDVTYESHNANGTDPDDVSVGALRLSIVPESSAKKVKDYEVVSVEDLTFHYYHSFAHSKTYKRDYLEEWLSEYPKARKGE